MGKIALRIGFIWDNERPLMNSALSVYKTSPERASQSSSHHAAHSAENHSQVGTRQNFENAALRHGMFIGFRSDDKLLQLKLK